MGQNGYLPRVVDHVVQDSLGYSGGVLLEGVRACGKTMTGRRHASSEVALDSGLPQLRAATVADLEALEGIGPYRAKLIKENLAHQAQAVSAGIVGW